MININDDKLLFYDVEVFKYDTLVVFKDIDKNVVAEFHNDFTGIIEVLQGKTLVGYNNYYYDDIILTELIKGSKQSVIKNTNDQLINGNCRKKPDIRLKSLDTFQQISVSRPGLKKIEGNMGLSIIESKIPFDIDRPLTDAEIKETFEYCRYDVDVTVEVWKIRKNSYFAPKLELVKRLGYQKAYKWNTTTISANLLLDKPLTKWSTHRIPASILELVPTEVVDMWGQVNDLKEKIEIKKVIVEEFDNVIEFGFGGLHSVKKGKKRFENVILSDVGSMYPSIIILENILGHATNEYKGIKNERMEVKHKDLTLSDALKLILNSVYGLLKNQYSTLYNENASTTVCGYGQAVLYELARRLSSTSEIVQLNTDGVMYQSDNVLYKDIVKEWEKDFGLSLETEYFKLLIQRDVNNYIAVDENDSITVKGGDVKRYDKNYYFDNNSLRIIDIAIVNKLVHGIDVLQTIQDNLDKPILFQYILQAGHTYLGTFDGANSDGDETTEHKQYNKVNRVFASKTSKVCLGKKRKDGGLVKFPDAPDKMLVYNDSLDKMDLEQFKKDIDINHYYKLINKKLEKWL